MLKPPSDILNPNPPKPPRQPQWWAGFLTLLVIIGVAAMLSWGAQYGLALTYTLDSHALYYAFYVLNFIGLTAGAMVESGGHGLVYDLHQTGQHVAFIVNALLYALLIFLWLKYHGDARLKK